MKELKIIVERLLECDVHVEGALLQQDELELVINYVTDEVIFVYHLHPVEEGEYIEYTSCMEDIERDLIESLFDY